MQSYKIAPTFQHILWVKKLQGARIGDYTFETKEKRHGVEMVEGSCSPFRFSPAPQRARDCKAPVPHKYFSLEKNIFKRENRTSF